MKRQYWKRGGDGGRFAVAALAFVVLGAAYAYGLLYLVTELEPVAESFASAALREDQSSRNRPMPEAQDTVAPQLPVPRNEREQAPLREPATEPIRAHQAQAAPDACSAAMAAALSNARIEFLSSSTQIVPASRNVISVLAALAHACPGQIRIAGHSDNLGPEAVNEQLSLARAQSVAAAFIEFGVAPERLTVLGFGSREPIADNATRAGRARNRRIEMTLTE